MDFDHDMAHFSMTPVQWFPEIISWNLDDTGFPVFVNMARDLGIMMLHYGQYFS